MTTRYQRFLTIILALLPTLETATRKNVLAKALGIALDDTRLTPYINQGDVAVVDMANQFAAYVYSGGLKPQFLTNAYLGEAPGVEPTF